MGYKIITMKRQLLLYLIKLFVGIVIIIICWLALTNIFVECGVIIPANYSETILEENRKRLDDIQQITDNDLPYGSKYSIFDLDYNYERGTMNKSDIEVTKKILLGKESNLQGNYVYSVIARTEEYCVIKYNIKARFNSDNKIFNYIDIPLQHSSPEVLKAMRRPAFDYRELIAKIRKKIPNVAVRTTFIVGYPNETEEDFEHLKKFVEDVKFDRMGVFEYSLEKGTYSYDLPNRVPARIKHRRKNQLMKIQQKISKKINEDLIGKKIECIVEYTTDDGIITARTYKDAPEVDGLIYLKTRNEDDTVIPGDIVVATVTNADNYDLCGEIE